MGRLAAYLGPKTKIAHVVEGGATSLFEQAADHTDGFGIAWYPADEDDDAPIVLRSAAPLSASAHLLEAPRRYTSECVVASAVRSGDAGLSGCQPFRHEDLLFAHDGTLERFDEIFARNLRQGLSDRTYSVPRSADPSEHLFAVWLDALGVQRGPEAMATALEQMVGRVQDIALKRGVLASFACVVTDGTCLITLRTATSGTPPPLFTIVAEEGMPVPMSGRVLASEPLFRGAWTALDPHSLVIFTVEEDQAAA